MLENKEGQKIPDVTFHTRQGHEWVDVSSRDIFKNKNVVVFALPGAFTPTCSSTHVPRYNQLAPIFKQHGIDEIVCMSVNDAFVMNEWQAEQKADNLTFIPDGNGDFAREMGMLVEKQTLGFGPRSWRYSMLVRDGLIERMFIEPEEDGDPFGVSDADTMLAHIAPEANKPLDITLFTRKGCGFCVHAKELLKSEGLTYEELVLNKDYSEQTLRAIANSSKVPQVFINGNLMGGSIELEAWLKRKEAA